MTGEIHSIFHQASCLVTAIAGLAFIVCVIALILTKRKEWLKAALTNALIGILSFGALVAVTYVKDAAPNPAESASGVLTDDQALLMFPAADWAQPKIAQSPNYTFCRANFFKDQNCWVFSKSKDESPASLQEHLDSFLSKIASKMTSRETTMKLSIDGYPALQQGFDCIQNDKNLSFLLTIIETPNSVHYIAMSTKTRNKAVAMPVFRAVTSKTRVMKP